MGPALNEVVRYDSGHSKGPKENIVLTVLKGWLNHVVTAPGRHWRFARVETPTRGSQATAKLVPQIADSHPETTGKAVVAGSQDVTIPEVVSGV